RRAVVLGGREKSRVVLQPQALHERRDELTGRQAAQAAVFRRHDDIEAPRRAGDQPLPGKPVYREPCGRGGYAEGVPEIRNGKVIVPFTGKTGDQISGFGHGIGSFRFHTSSISEFDILRKRTWMAWQW